MYCTQKKKQQECRSGLAQVGKIKAGTGETGRRKRKIKLQEQYEGVEEEESRMTQ